jgi:dienelactone hydrolase
VDKRHDAIAMNYLAQPGRSAEVASSPQFTVSAVKWSVFPGLDAEGLLLEPKANPKGSVVGVPDAEQSPEQLTGLAAVDATLPPLAAELAQHCRVIVPTLINRLDTWSGSERFQRFTNQTHREYIYRLGFNLGRHIIGWEIQKILAAADWLKMTSDPVPLGICGIGEGGMLALYSAALDERVAVVASAGDFGPRDDLWKFPIYRNVWRVLREFGNGSLLRLLAPRSALLQLSPKPTIAAPAERPGRTGAAPGSFITPDFAAVRKEWEHVHATLPPIVRERCKLVWRNERTAKGLALEFCRLLKPAATFEQIKLTLIDAPRLIDQTARQKRQFDQLVGLSQSTLHEAEHTRRTYFWNQLDYTDLTKFRASTRPYVAQLWEEIVGKLPAPTSPRNVRTRQIFDEPKWRGYEVKLDVYPHVYAFGILTVPKDLKPGERRPVVVCQHGLSGKIHSVVNPRERTRAYNSFGSALADQGYVVFAPQNPYIGETQFRQLQRKANPLGLSLFSFIVRQHELILDWLATLPFVNPERMGFYGLSYGGKTAMRVPALLDRYCLSICSGDFNEWTWKIASLDFSGGYQHTREYEIYEWNQGMTLGYAEMTALIAPRPFMVERGHNDGVGIDEWVAYEYAKVRRMYARLGIADRTEIEFFQGGHEIHGRGTFEFLRKHLLG